RRGHRRNGQGPRACHGAAAGDCRAARPPARSPRGCRPRDPWSAGGGFDRAARLQYTQCRLRAMRWRDPAGGPRLRGDLDEHRQRLQLGIAGALAGPARDGISAIACPGRHPVLALERQHGGGDRPRVHRVAPDRVARPPLTKVPLYVLNRPRTTEAIPSAPPEISSWNGSSALANSCAVWNRAAGLICSAWWTTSPSPGGMSGRSDSTPAIRPERSASCVSSLSAPWMARWFVSAS